MVNGKPMVISLFSGCGGSSLGYRWAGFREILAVDFDRLAVETFRLNFPGVPYWQKDIRKVTGRKIMEFCGIGRGELDLLDASPPCQGFSTAGKRQVNDEKNDLFKEFVRLVKELEPKTFVMENVAGLIKGKMKGRFIEIMGELKSLPYQVKCKLMNAMYYGVPQSRSRLIWIGIRKDLINGPLFPEPNNKYITVEEAIGGLPLQDVPVDKTRLAKQYWEKARHGGPVGKYKCRIKLNPRKVAAVNKASRPNYHYEFARSLSVMEMQILEGFPGDFKWGGNYYDQTRMIGNSVCPRFMEAIARTIKEGILDHAPIS